MASIHKLIIKSPFCDLFPIDENLVEIIANDIRLRQFDNSRPIVVWKETGVLVDGHTRVKAATLAGRQIVPHVEKSFPDEEEALQYAIHNQRNRRNMTEADLLRCIKTVDRRREQHKDARGKFTVASIDATGKSAKQTAEIVGTSQAKVERARKVLSDPKEKEEVMAGKKTIYRASEDAKRRQVHKPQRNEKGKFIPKDQQILLAEAYNELRAWRKKYKNLSGLTIIFQLVDKCLPQ